MKMYYENEIYHKEAVQICCDKYGWHPEYASKPSMEHAKMIYILAARLHSAALLRDAAIDALPGIYGAFYATELARIREDKE